MKRKIILSVFLVLLLASIVVYNMSNKIDYSDPNISEKKVIRITKYYLDNVENYNQSNLEEVLFFSPQYSTWKEPIFRAMQEDPLLSYKIDEVTKINQSLYEVVFHHDNKLNKDLTDHNYIVYINGEWKYVINRRDVPKEIYVFDSYDDTTLY